MTTQTTTTTANDVPTHAGTCHCGAVRFEARLHATSGSRCNCSICTKIGAPTSIVKPDAFRVSAGESELSSYAWGGKTGTRYFCRHCGVHCFGRGHLAEVGGDYVSVNLNTLDDIDPATLQLSWWDGRHDNWQAGTRSTPWPITRA